MNKGHSLELIWRDKHIRVPHWLLALIVITWALGLSIFRLGSKSLWIDEADSVYFAQHTWTTLVFGLCDPHPPFITHC